jgi:hypothetical protein
MVVKALMEKYPKVDAKIFIGMSFYCLIGEYEKIVATKACFITEYMMITWK